MLYPPVADLLKKVDSRYLLVNLVAHRARQIAAEAEAFQEDLPEKPVTMAIEEVGGRRAFRHREGRVYEMMLFRGMRTPSGKQAERMG